MSHDMWKWYEIQLSICRNEVLLQHGHAYCVCLHTITTELSSFNRDPTVYKVWYVYSLVLCRKSCQRPCLRIRKESCVPPTVLKIASLGSSDTRSVLNHKWPLWCSCLLAPIQWLGLYSLLESWWKARAYQCIWFSWWFSYLKHQQAGWQWERWRTLWNLWLVLYIFILKTLKFKQQHLD